MRSFTPCPGRVLRIAIVLTALLLPACDGFRKKPGPEPMPAARSQVADALLTDGTVGAEALLANVDTQPLRGFGLVVGLGGRGSSDCPSIIREYLIEVMSKELASQGGEHRNQPAPGELIDSPDTAVVEVTGVVPAGARKGARFDVVVRAVAGTSTQSLEGGLLLHTPLRYFDRAATGRGMVQGAELADATGPIFISPDSADLKASGDPRLGVILGGGRAFEARPYRLSLVRGNYQLAQTIQRRINERFGQRPPTAEAISAGVIEVQTPPAYARDPDHFRNVVAQLFLDARPEIMDGRLRKLAARATEPDADLPRIAATWEAAGRAALPFLQPLFLHPRPRVRLLAATPALRLNALSALPVVGALTAAGEPEDRLLAVRELAECDSPQTSLHLAPLLSDPDQDVRIAAYEALLQRGNGAIRSTTFRHVLDRSQINFVLDVIDCAGPPLIFVRRTRLPRVAVFGSTLPVTPPVFYVPDDGAVTIHTVDGSTDLRVFAKRKKMSDEIVLAPRVPDLIAALAELPLRDDLDRLRGIGLTYTRVVRTLADLGRDQTIAARIALEGPYARPLPDIAPDRPEGERPEAEATADATPPAATTRPAGA
jgi:hypothetical protein